MSLQAVFKHKANAEDGIAPALFDPATVEIFEAKQKREEQETYAAISNSGGEVSTSYAPISARIRDMKQGAESESVKKRKARESFSKDLIAAIDWMDKMSDLMDKYEKLQDEMKELLEVSSAIRGALSDYRNSRELPEIDENGNFVDPLLNKAYQDFKANNPNKKADLSNPADMIEIMHAINMDNSIDRSRVNASLQDVRAELDELAQEKERHRSIVAIEREGSVEQVTRMRDIQSRQGEVLANSIQPLGVDLAIEELQKEVAHYKGMGISDRDLAKFFTDKIQEMSPEAQEVISDTPEAKRYIELAQEKPENKVIEVPKAVEQNSDLNLFNGL